MWRARPRPWAGHGRTGSSIRTSLYTTWIKTIGFARSGKRSCREWGSSNSAARSSAEECYPLSFVRGILSRLINPQIPNVHRLRKCGGGAGRVGPGAADGVVQDDKKLLVEWRRK